MDARTPLSIASIATRSETAASQPIYCFSHLRWDFVFQRPQQLMSRFAQDRPVIFWEEPEMHSGTEASLHLREDPGSGVMVATPQLPEQLDAQAVEGVLKHLLDGLVESTGMPAVTWYYTPMMLPFSRHLAVRCAVYDCMDELANFRFAPPELTALEQELLDRADLVFTGGYSLYEAKRHRHPRVFPFPSSVDRDHFATARGTLAEPVDLKAIPGPGSASMA